MVCILQKEKKRNYIQEVTVKLDKILHIWLGVLNLPDTNGHVVRGEFILKSVFEENMQRNLQTQETLFQVLLIVKRLITKQKIYILLLMK